MARLALPLICALALGASLFAQTPGASLSGRVLNSVTKGGIAGVSLLLCSAPKAPPQATPCGPPNLPNAVTDESGAFRIEGLPPGRYSLLPMPTEGFFPPLKPQPQIDVSGDTRVDLQMTPLANIRGRVFDPDGEPAPGVVVALDALNCENCTAMDVSVTDEDGRFSFEKLPPGEPLVISASPKTQADAKADERIVTTYYPSVVDRDQAEEINSQGVDLFGYNIRLRTAPAHRIRGVVVDTDDKPVAHAIVSIVKPSTAMPAMIRGLPSGRSSDVPVAEPAETKEDGTFTFSSVREGDWMLRAVGGQIAHAGSAEVNVEKTDMENVELRVALPITIEMAADWGDTPPPPDQPAIAVALRGGFIILNGGSEGPAFLPLDTPRMPPPLERGFGSADPAEFRGFAGKYLIGPGNAPAGFYLAAVLLNDRDVMGQVADLAAGHSLKLVYKKDGGSVRGTVEKADDATTVILMADPTPTARIGYSARCDSSGAFNARDLPPGEYTAVAVQELSRNPFGPEFLAMLAANGKRIRLEPGATVQTDLRIAQ